MRYALLALALCLPGRPRAQAPESPVFKPNYLTTRKADFFVGKTAINLVLIEGTVNGKWGQHVRNDSFDSSAVFARVGKAKTSDEADRLCRDFAPQGRWRLPNQSEFLAGAQDYGTFPGFAVEPGNDGPDKRGYIAWAGKPDGTAALLLLREGDLQTAELGDLKRDLLRSLQEAAQNPEKLGARARMSRLRKIYAYIQDGTPVYCVTGSAGN